MRTEDNQQRSAATCCVARWRTFRTTLCAISIAAGMLVFNVMDSDPTHVLALTAVEPREVLGRTEERVDWDRCALPTRGKTATTGGPDVSSRARDRVPPRPTSAEPGSSPGTRGFLDAARYEGLLQDSKDTSADENISVSILTGAIPLVHDTFRGAVNAGLVAHSWLSCQVPFDRRERLTVCGIARGQGKLAVEWAVWHALLGAEVVVIDDGDNGDAALHLTNLSRADIVTVLETNRSNATEPLASRGERSAAALCRRHIAESQRAWSAMMLRVDEFVVDPRLANRTAYRSSRSAPPCLAETVAMLVGPRHRRRWLPVRVVGHGGQRRNIARTMLERSNYAAGDLKGVMTWRAVWTCASEDELTEDVIRGLPPPSTSIVTDMSPVILKYGQPSLAAALQAVLLGDVVDAIDTHGGVFRVEAVIEAWQKRGQGVGLLPFRGEAARRLVAHNAMLLMALGFSAGDRERAMLSNPHGGVDRGERLVAAGVLVPVRPSTTAEKAPSPPSNGAVVRGEYVPAAEPPVAGLTAERIKAAVDGAPCTVPPRRSDQRLNVVLCTIVRNRAKITQEWLLWHAMLGVSFVHVFDDGSTDGLREAMRPFEEAGIAKVYDAPGPPYTFKGTAVRGVQLAAYDICTTMEEQAASSGPRSWVGYMDTDEFVYFRKSNTCIPEYLQVWSRRRPNNLDVKAVALPWRIVGHRGEEVDRAVTQMERTAFALGVHDDVQRVKTFVESGAVVGMVAAHAPRLRAGRDIVLPDGKPLRGDGWFSGVVNGSTAEEDAVILHYHARSLASWYLRHLDGDVENSNLVLEFDLEILYGQWDGARQHTATHTAAAAGNHSAARCTSPPQLSPAIAGFYPALVSLLGGTQCTSNPASAPNAPTNPKRRSQT